MIICPNCGVANVPDARFCASCGDTMTGAAATAAAAVPAAGGQHPAEPTLAFVPSSTPPRKSPGNAAIVAGILALGLLAGGITYLITRDDSPAATEAAPGRTDSTDPTQVTGGNEGTGSTPAVTVPGSGEPSTTAATTLPATTLAPDPLTQLEQRRDTDRAVVESLVGTWVPQVSAKRPGMVADGITYTLPDIIALHQQLSEKFGAVLLFSGEYNYQSNDLWVSIVPQGFADPDQALAFCTANSIDRDNCFAKFITHDASITDTTKLLPA